MPNVFKPTDHLKDYYKEWISVYKEGAIRDVTLSKYKMSHLSPGLSLLYIWQRRVYLIRKL